MESIKIKRLAFNSYLELTSIIGLMTGIYTMLVSLFQMYVAVDNNYTFPILSVIMVVVFTPLFSVIGGLILGVLTYYPYKWIMNIKKGTTLKVIKYESDVNPSGSISESDE